MVARESAVSVPTAVHALTPGNASASRIVKTGSAVVMAAAEAADRALQELCV